MTTSRYVHDLVAATTKRIEADRERLAAVRGAHDVDGLSYPAISRGAFALLAADGIDAERHGLGPDNLRKMH